MSQGLFRKFRVLWMPLEAEWAAPRQTAPICCQEMRSAVTFTCDQHSSPFDCADAVLVYNHVFDEYGLIIHDGGLSYLLIAHCPWCGAVLPESQRDRWFDETDKLSGEDGDALPTRYLNDTWRMPPLRR